MQNVVGPTLVAMATKFGLAAEIQSPTGLSVCLVCLSTRSLPKFSGHHHMVERADKFVNGYVGVRGWCSNVSDVQTDRACIACI